MLDSTRNSTNRQQIFADLGLLPFLEKRETVQIGNLPLHYELYPHASDAPTLLFIPGIGTYSELYCELLARLSDQGFNVVGVDLRGHGYSGGPRGRYRVEQVIADLQQVMNHLEARFSGPFGLFGCSLGARLGLALAEVDPRIRALLCHTLFLAEMPPDMWHSLGWSWLSLSGVFMPDFKVSFRSFVDVEDMLATNPMGRYASTDPLLVWDYPLSTLRSVYSYPSGILKSPLEIPSAIMIGDRDDVIRVEYARDLAARSAQPFDLLEIENAGHMLPFEHLEATLETSSDWFARALGR
ncbi:alpha/beta fold hydrolase [Motiliproteus sp. SC1-56]|uniref:alpha/beta fold hydrolase n=1 Tax=Motiliproteus sp. SC1-56 TaxID=2799565 RepID=UPI001A8FA7AB|nr:alpha/beta hydrolase [Motiliproteus sp. SC1-56]